jgi:predicted dehydrogenase
VADINGVFAAQAVRKFGAGDAVSDYRRVLDDPAIQAVFILVGHHLHARFVCEALEAGKHVFVEKPLALNESELIQVEEATARATDRLIMVGFNRRFSPHVAKIKALFAGRAEPICMNMTVNAGFIPPEHWVQDPLRGGGRIIGEGCHFIDLLAFLAGSPVTAVSAMMVGGNGPIREDKISIVLGFADGSVGTVNYFANGSKSYPKETLEVFGDGRVIRMENFLATRGYGFKGFHSFRTWRQDKGHRAEVAAFVDRVATGGEQLIPFNQMANVTRASFAAMEAARTGKVIVVSS